MNKINILQKLKEEHLGFFDLERYDQRIPRQAHQRCAWDGRGDCERFSLADHHGFCDQFAECGG